MRSPISGKSSETAARIAGILGAIAYKCSEGGDLFAFATDCQKIDISREAPLIDITNITVNLSNSLGGGTDLNKALRLVEHHSDKTGTKYDNLLVLTDMDCYGYGMGGSRHKYADAQVDDLLKKGVFRKIWVNNLMGNNFSIVNTNQYTKNLVTGFSEKFLEVLNTYNELGRGANIKKVIDEMLEKKRRA